MEESEKRVAGKQPGFSKVFNWLVGTMTESADSTSPDQSRQPSLIRLARIPGLRALAWSGDLLYASRGYRLFRAHVNDVSRGLNWQPAGEFQPSWRRKLSVSNRLSARLFRDGFHALAVLPSGVVVGAVPREIVTLGANDTKFRRTHAISRGTRPLHITAVPDGTVFWGEYFDNPSREDVHIYASTDAGETWNISYTFPRGAIRHVHNIVHDPWRNCLWVLTGDHGDECRILRAACDFSRVETVLQGKQQTRAAAAIPCEDGLYFTSDTPLEANHIYRLDDEGKLSTLGQISSSSIYGCRVGSQLFFSTMIEPSEVNRDRRVQVYRGDVSYPERWQPVLDWRKDRWPIGLFQYGNAFFPDGTNPTPYLALTTIAVESDDITSSIYRLSP